MHASTNTITTNEKKNKFKRIQKHKHKIRMKYQKNEIQIHFRNSQNYKLLFLKKLCKSNTKNIFVYFTYRFLAIGQLYSYKGDNIYRQLWVRSDTTSDGGIDDQRQQNEWPRSKSAIHSTCHWGTNCHVERGRCQRFTVLNYIPHIEIKIAIQLNIDRYRYKFKYWYIAFGADFLSVCFSNNFFGPN